MKRTFITLLAIMALTSSMAAQNRQQKEIIQPDLTIRLSLLFPQVSLEAKLTEQTTMVAGFWTGISNYYDPAYQDYRVIFTPQITLEPRYYFNVDTRLLKGKRVDHYSGAYLAFPFHVEFPELKYNMGPCIGFQKTLGHRGYINMSIGPGVAYYEEQVRPDIISSFGLGFILN